jgi:hypothetical protein
MTRKHAIVSKRERPTQYNPAGSQLSKGAVCKRLIFSGFLAKSCKTGHNQEETQNEMVYFSVLRNNAHFQRQKLSSVFTREPKHRDERDTQTKFIHFST